MGKKKMGCNKDDWRNSTEPYTIELTRDDYILNEKNLCYHIDNDTLAYKQWHTPELEVLSRQDNKLELSNRHDGVRYILTILMDTNQFHVSCSCSRKVERLCHHAYHALHHIITRFGIHYFKPKP